MFLRTVGQLGTPLNEISPDCPVNNFCWISGAFDNPEHSPLFLQVRFDNIQKGSLWAPDMPQPPNQIFVLIQINPSLWAYNDSDWSCNLTFNSVKTELTLVKPMPMYLPVFLRITTPCLLDLNNSLLCIAPQFYCDGTGKILGVS